MIHLYTAKTFNGQRVSIMLEELELAYTVHRIDLAKDEQRQDKFLQLNHSGRIPVIVDHDNGGIEPLVLTQSTAILQYLAEKTGQLLPKTLDQRAKVYEWLHFHAIDIGSVIFSAFYLHKRCSPTQVKGAEQLSKRVYELYQYFDEQLMDNEYLAGDFYSIADITAIPAVISQEQTLGAYPHLNRWLQQLKKRPAVERGMLVPKQVEDHAS